MRSKLAGVFRRRLTAEALEVDRRIYLGDDDSSGLIFFPSYFVYMSQGDQQLMERLGAPVWEHGSLGRTCPTVHAECDMTSPVVPGDRLRQRVILRPGGRSSFTCEHEFTKGGEVVARGRVVHVWVDLETMKPVAPPQGFPRRNPQA